MNGCFVQGRSIVCCVPQAWLHLWVIWSIIAWEEYLGMNLLRVHMPKRLRQGKQPFQIQNPCKLSPQTLSSMYVWPRSIIFICFFIVSHPNNSWGKWSWPTFTSQEVEDWDSGRFPSQVFKTRRIFKGSCFGVFILQYSSGEAQSGWGWGTIVAAPVSWKQGVVVSHKPHSGMPLAFFLSKFFFCIQHFLWENMSPKLLENRPWPNFAMFSIFFFCAHLP